MISPARHRHSLGSHEDETGSCASCSEFPTHSAQSEPTRRACRIGSADLATDLRGSTDKPPFADDRHSRFVFSSLDDLHRQRIDSYVGHPVDYPSLSSRTLCVSGASHLHVPDDHLHFSDVDHFLPELKRSTAILAVRPAGILPADKKSQPGEDARLPHRQDACAPISSMPLHKTNQTRLHCLNRT